MEEKNFETENTEELNELMRDRMKEREASAGEGAENAENTENAENIEKVENTENTELLYAARCHIGARETAVLADQYSRKFTIGFAVAVPIIFLCLAWLLGFSDNDMIFGIVMCVLAAVSVPSPVPTTASQRGNISTTMRISRTGTQEFSEKYSHARRRFGSPCNKR